MISTFNSTYNFRSEVNAIIMEDTYISKNKNSLRLYIPTMMTNIPSEEPITSIVPINGKSMFSNAPENTPVSRTNILTEKNYIEATLQSNSNFKDMEMITELLSDKDLLYKISKGSPVRVQFLNGKADKPAYKFTGESNVEMELIERE